MRLVFLLLLIFRVVSSSSVVSLASCSTLQFRRFHFLRGCLNGLSYYEYCHNSCPADSFRVACGQDPGNAAAAGFCAKCADLPCTTGSVRIHCGEREMANTGAYQRLFVQYSTAVQTDFLQGVFYVDHAGLAAYRQAELSPPLSPTNQSVGGVCLSCTDLGVEYCQEGFISTVGFYRVGCGYDGVRHQFGECVRCGTCEPGYERVGCAGNSAGQCRPCPVGKYKPSLSADQCQTCPNGGYFEGATSVSECGCLDPLTNYTTKLCQCPAWNFEKVDSDGSSLVFSLSHRELYNYSREHIPFQGGSRLLYMLRGGFLEYETRDSRDWLTASFWAKSFESGTAIRVETDQIILTEDIAMQWRQYSVSFTEKETLRISMVSGAMFIDNLDVNMQHGTCQWECPRSSTRTGDSCVQCPQISEACAVDQYVTGCFFDTVLRFECQLCYNALEYRRPDNSRYFARPCRWECLDGYFWNGSHCEECRVRQCRVGYFARPCGGDTAGECEPCTGLEEGEMWISAGTGENNCLRACDDLHFEVNGRCFPCSTDLCERQGIFTRTVKCTANRNSYCTVCEPPLVNGRTVASATEIGAPCLTTCNAGYYDSDNLCRNQSFSVPHWSDPFLPGTYHAFEGQGSFGGVSMNFDSNTMCDKNLASCSGTLYASDHYVGYSGDGLSIGYISIPRGLNGTWDYQISYCIDRSESAIPTETLLGARQEVMGLELTRLADGNVRVQEITSSGCYQWTELFVTGSFILRWFRLANSVTTFTLFNLTILARPVPTICMPQQRSCKPCTNDIPVNATYSGPGIDTTCPVSCKAGFENISGECVFCAKDCGPGNYLSACQQCSPCTAVNAIFNGVGLPSDPLSCPYACPDDFFRMPDGAGCQRCSDHVCSASHFHIPCSLTANARCEPCTVCAAGEQTVRVCNGTQNTVCEPCAAAPPFSAYVAPECAWQCKEGYDHINGECVFCQPSCGVGEYSGNCTDENVGGCYPCHIPPHAVAVGNSEFGPNSCPWDCLPGFSKFGGACVPEEKLEIREKCPVCPKGQKLHNCKCVDCTKPNGTMTEFTRNCDWVCVHPYVRDRSGLFCVAVKPTIKRQQRSKQKRVKVDNRVVVYTAIPLVILTLLSLVLVFR